MVDGDTLKIDGVTYRPWGIDAPEAAPPCADGWPAGSLWANRRPSPADRSRLEAAPEGVNWFGCAAAPKHFSRSSLQDRVGCMRSEAFAQGTFMTKFLSLGFVLAAATLLSGCFSFSSTTRTAPPPPAPAPVVQRTYYPDGTYVDQIVQPVPR